MKTILFIFVILGVIASVLSTGNCPPSSQMVSCSPKCTSDSECSVGTKCCPNICNQKSCSASNKNSGASGYKAGITTATGTYCGNAKCSPNEKCVVDNKDKRSKCVRG